MTSRYNLLFLLPYLLIFIIPVQAQQMIPGQMDTLRGIPRDMNTMVRRSPAFQYNRSQRANGGGATIHVTYTGFTAPAQAAFQYAVDIWAAQLVSDVPIEVEAEFSALSPGVLGSAGATYYLPDFTNAPIANTYYPAALANSLAGCDLAIDLSDITASFSSSATWYFGTDGLTPPGEYDFVSVVLHELGHGLGFVGTASENAGTGSFGLGGSNYPVIYDRYVENGSGTALTTYTNPSGALGAQLVSDDLFSNAPTAVAANGAANVKLYLPGTFDPGSSYSHWDDATYPAGNPHSLMTHAIGTAEAIHDPGDITRGLFEDMGWKLTNQAEAKMEVRTVWFSDLAALSFTDASILATSWAWDFDNNSIVDATVQNPTYTYPGPGTYTARLTINGNPALTTSRTIEIGTSPTLPYIEDFDTDDGNYYAYHLAGCDGDWGYGTSNSSNFNSMNGAATITGAGSWATDLNNSHGFNTRYALEMPPIDLSTPTHDYILEFDYRAACGSDAGFNVEYSTDAGTTWNTLGSVGDPNATNWYNSAALGGLDGEPGFTQAAFTVFRPTYMLNFLFGNSDVRFRFRFGAQGFALDGIQLDNIEINGILLDGNQITLAAEPAESQVDLTWTLETPEENGWFEIERADRTGEFLVIGAEPVAAGQRSFHFSDLRPLHGINAYRIRQQQTNGTFLYSATTEVYVEPSGKMAIYPNPARESITLRADLTGTETISLRLYDLSGKLLLSRQWQAAGPFEEQVSLNGLPSGLYLYELKNRTSYLRDKLLVE